MKVGILAVQGDFEAHAATLARLGVEYVFVRTPADMHDVDAVILPGGESTTQWKFLAEEGLDKALLTHAAKGGAFFGTCAGAILLATEVENPPQAGLGALNIRIRRNAYGRQIDSSIREGKLLSDLANNPAGSPLEMVFIRAPKIERIGEGVEVLATEGSDPVAVRQGRAMAATFHPELSEDTRVHQAFLNLVKNRKALITDDQF